MKKLISLLLLIAALVLVSVFFSSNKNIPKKVEQIGDNIIKDTHPLQIEAMRERGYPGSNLKIEEELNKGSNYTRHIASYQSEGLKIFGLLTIPEGEKPKEGYPAVIFNHGYIPPEEYRTTERYVAYVDGFAKNGYIVFRPDYRGHGSSEGKPEGAYYSPAYTIDVLNAVSSVKKLKEVNPEKIGMWGHSLGGHITLRSMVINNIDIKVGVIWAGVVAPYLEMINNWRGRTPWRPSGREQTANRPSRQNFIDKYGMPDKNPSFWKSISPNSYLKDIAYPIQIHHGTNDETVPLEFSKILYDGLKKENKTVEYYEYEGNDHNLSQSFNLVMNRSVEFFDKYLK